MSDLIEGFLGKSIDGKKSRLPAKLDYIQSATGLFLGLFMWGHMFFVSTILISKDAMLAVTRFFEGSMFLKEPQPVIVSFVVAFVFIIFIVHAGLGMRKFPINFRQFQVYKTHMKMMKHSDTTLWFVQAITGFIMFFLGSAHLYMMMTKASEIGPYASSDRMWSDFMWPFYLILLLAVEFHGSIGLYRLCVKWGWFEGKNSKETRAKLVKVKWAITAFFLALGILTLAAYMKIGYEHRNHVGERYMGAIEYNIAIDRKVEA
ncbi:MAG: fumarate reductase cytochrome b subunit [Sulfurospirillaceae bacterium]|nr:fumarate reductase cytochrome b subunit [Sulfurospirillaceae bacterium]MCK9545682.1 fumarate reductase cytochrome b subunit [Sulfurospirillaceae bacterium]NLM99501.1 fumarate reductase cytochrome b subunit [Campylobacteraceae bacterium]